MTQAVRSSAIVREEVHRVVRRDVLWILLDKFRHCIPERRDRLHVFQHRERETWAGWRVSFAREPSGYRILTVRFVVLFHEYERVVLDVAEVLDIRSRRQSGSIEQRGDGCDLLDSPVVSVLLQQLVVVEKSRVEPTHVAICETS